MEHSLRLPIKGLPKADEGSTTRPQPESAPDSIAERARRLAFTGADNGALLLAGAGLLTLGAVTAGAVTIVRRRRVG